MVLNRCLQLKQHNRELAKTAGKFLEIHAVAAFIHENALFRKTTQYFILKLKLMYYNLQFSQRHFHINATMLRLSKPYVGLLRI